LNLQEILPQIIDFFRYREDSPLIFTSKEFWIFFSLFLSGYSLLSKNSKFKNPWILLFSLFFYYKSSGWAVILLLFTVTQDYFIALLMGRSAGNSIRKFLVCLSVCLNLLVLAYFKYAFLLADWLGLVLGKDIPQYNWLASIIPGKDLLQLNVDNILLPVGISFFLFHSISYTVDVYRKAVPPLKSWVDYAVFVSFFPELVAGPIVRARDFVEQLSAPFSLSKADFGKGVALVMGGLFKKIVISDMLSTGLADKVFDQAELASVLETWLAVVAYAFQIFCDFSGYTDIAIGLALLLGYHLKPNFNEPYKAVNITDFWRRWHISLSVWLRDYLYIPLGGNRNGKIMTYINLLITMLLGGLWHGASLKFLIWGGLHGGALALHKGWMELEKYLPFRIPGIIGGLLTFLFVALCWIPFRAEDLETTMRIVEKLRMIPDWGQAAELINAYKLTLGCLLAGILLHYLPWNWKEHLFSLCGKMPVWLLGLCCLAGIILIFQFSSGDSQPFIYFQF
jgi:alginate O-acetyltransferase complex protein AlgI